MTKVDLIRENLMLSPNASTKSIAEDLECSEGLVRRVRNGSYVTPFKNAKEAALARNAELGKRVKRK
jgi:hypothetical protein